MIVKIITNEKFEKATFASGKVGSAVIRGKWLVEAWDEASEWHNGDFADAMIFQKAYWKTMLEDFPGKKILDLCDPDWMDSKMNLVELAQHCDAITCSNDGITNFVKTIVKHIPVITVPDRLNLDYFTRKKKHLGTARNAVYFGFAHNATEVLPQVLPSLGRLGLDLIVVSNKPYQPIVSYGVKVKFVRWDQATAYDDIAFGDIAINPPSARANFRYKSNNKTIIAWGLGLPVANTADDMAKFMDQAAREKEAALRWEEVQRDWDIKLSVQQYKDLLANIKK